MLPLNQPYLKAAVMPARTPLSCVGNQWLDNTHILSRFSFSQCRYLDQYTAVELLGTAEEPEIVDDEDGEVLGLEALLSQILNVIRTLMESSKKEFKAVIKSNLPDLVLYTITCGFPPDTFMLSDADCAPLMLF
jgi:hypothetical protein